MSTNLKNLLSLIVLNVLKSSTKKFKKKEYFIPIKIYYFKLTMIILNASFKEKLIDIYLRV